MEKNSVGMFALIQEDDWKTMLEGQKRMLDKMEELRSIIQNREPDAANDWLTLEEAREMINVCPKTFQKYRDNGIIPFSQYGRKIYFKRKDIEAFLDSKRVRR